MPKPTTPDDRFERIDETLDRVLFEIQNLQAGQAEIRADIHRIRVSTDTLLRGST